MASFSNPFRAEARDRDRTRRRNPRFAPETLETRLSPSSLGLTVPAEVGGSCAVSDKSDPAPPPSGIPPVGPPPPPPPSGPAF